MAYKNKTDLYTNQINRWIKRKQRVVALLGGKCAHCGYSRHYSALTLHHRDPSTKRWEWSKLRLRAWVDVEAEIAKCDLLCMNCHAELHAKLSPELREGIRR